MQETCIWPLGQEGPGEKEMATNSSILAWRGAWQATVHGVARVRHDWATNTVAFSTLYYSYQWIYLICSWKARPGFTHIYIPHVEHLSFLCPAVCDSVDWSRRRQWQPTPVTLAWKIPWTEEPGRLQSMGSQRVGHNWATSLSLFTFMRWRRKWQHTPVFLSGESQGQRSLVGCRPWGHTESDTTEAT